MNKYKDCLPIKTNNRIQNILFKIGLAIYEQGWNNQAGNFFSLRVELVDFPVGTNGKGTTRMFAIASAYGELMERIQNISCLPDTYGLKGAYALKRFHDESDFDPTEFLLNVFLTRNPCFAEKEEFIEFIKTTKIIGNCTPYYHVNSDKVEYLPYHFINLFTGTNGSCAGNTPEEAIIHGICEVLERYVIKEVIFNELILPTIPLFLFQKTELYGDIIKLQEEGYLIKVKDCTLGGNWPVIGLLLISPDRNKYCIRFGSEPILDIAFERCFTEIYQGVSYGSNSCFNNIDWNLKMNIREEKIKNLSQFVLNGKGHLPNTIFQDGSFC